MSTAHAPIHSDVFNRFQEESYNRLAAISSYSGDGRQLYRAQHAKPHLVRVEHGRLYVRVWHVPSTRREGVTWITNLNTGHCCEAGTNKACPDKASNHKQFCSHYIAALDAERVWCAENMDNGFITVERKIDELPAQRKPETMAEALEVNPVVAAEQKPFYPRTAKVEL